MADIFHQLAGQDGEVLVVRIPAELNHETAEPLRELVHRRLPNRDGAGLVLDFSDVLLISSIGVAALLQVHEFCHDREAPMVLASVSRRQLDFFKMLTIERKFRRAEDVAGAVAEVQSGRSRDPGSELKGA